jgi:hypothetical protein
LRGLHRFGMHLRLPERRGSAGHLVPVRRVLQLRPDVHLQGLPARERTPSGEPVVHADSGVLAVMGSVCMMLALVLAWCPAGVRSSRFVKGCIPSPQYLLKAHLDFLMMTGLLFLFFLLFEHLRLTPPTVVVVAMSLGSVGNPSGFLALAIRPDLPQRPATPFGALMVLSFTATTVGYGGAAWYVAHAIVHTAS